MQHVRAAWRRWLDSPVRDVILALGLTVVLVGGTAGEGYPKSPSDRILFPHHVIPHPPPAALLLVAAACLALIWRRRWPVAVLVISTALVTGYTLLGYVNGAALLIPAVAVYSVATQLNVWRAGWLALGTAAVLMTATGAFNPFGQIAGGGFDLIPFMMAAALLAGIAVANRRAYVASIRDRAQEDARRQVVEERLRIARELHDVVAHTMATINVQAGSAAHVLSTRPEVAAEALQAIKAASKDGLRELRAILNVLRQADDADPTQPAPGLVQLDSLVAGARRSGLEATLRVTGEPVPLPPAADLAAYRIIQESLTNVIRHAGPAAATVTLDYGHRELQIKVADTGLGQPGGAAGQPGHGLAGMRERAAAVGGSVQAGPAPGGGFLVAARLPLARPPGQPGPDTATAAAATAEEGGRP